MLCTDIVIFDAAIFAAAAATANVDDGCCYLRFSYGHTTLNCTYVVRLAIAIFNIKMFFVADFLFTVKLLLLLFYIFYRRVWEFVSEKRFINI